MNNREISLASVGEGNVHNGENRMRGGGWVSASPGQLDRRTGRALGRETRENENNEKKNDCKMREREGEGRGVR